MDTSVQTPVAGRDRKDHFQPDGLNSQSSEPLALILQCLQIMKEGDFSVRLPVAWTGLPGKIADTFNEIVTANEQIASELKRVGLAVGKEGKTRERIRFERQ